MNYYYSATMNTFYLASIKQNYIDTGSFPDDAKEIEDDIFQQFAAAIPPEGKMRIAGKEGLPIWADIPFPTQKELIQQAEYEKQNKIQEVSKIIAPYQDAIDLGIATDKELMQLNAWKQYRVDLNRIDTATAPDITWPEKPE
ncbi:tail fiber assembly protein [Providencia rettgeri]|uniref:tail fiber assembly protein n=1 Tax=Providencia rettgeri TaxID=587 RepID=UPI00235EE887|nr:tail fiber assembly protein [Providencia rettgeri]